MALGPFRAEQVLATHQFESPQNLRVEDSSAPQPKTHSPRDQIRIPLDDDTRYRLLRLLTEHPELSQRELAGALGMSLGKTNYCLRALIGRGWVKVQNFRNSDNKLAYAYVLTPAGVTAKLRAAADFLRRKQGEFARLEREIAELRLEVESSTVASVADGSSSQLGHN